MNAITAKMTKGFKTVEITVADGQVTYVTAGVLGTGRSAVSITRKDIGRAMETANGLVMMYEARGYKIV